MKRKYTRLKLLELCDIQSLEDIISMFGENYNREVSYLKGNSSILESEKILINEWRTKDNKSIINSFTKNGQKVRYLIANAFIEMQVPEKRAIIDTKVLPKSSRVNSNEYEVIFFERNNKIYAILVCAESIDSIIKSHLMGAGRTKCELSERWGRINDDDIEDYTLSSDLFYWLITKNGQSLQIGEESFEINSIKALANSSLTGDNYSSEGEDLLDGVVTKTTLGTDSMVDSVVITLRKKGTTLDLRLDNNGTCGINKQTSITQNKDGKLDTVYNHFDEIIIELYCSIIPMIKSLYTEDVNNMRWTNHKLQGYKRNLILQVINDLCSENEISKEEVLGLDIFQE